MKIRPVEAELFHADRQTDMTKLIAAFRSNENERKNGHFKKFVSLFFSQLERNFSLLHKHLGDRGSTVIKVLCHKSEGHWFEPSWCQWIFH